MSAKTNKSMVFQLFSALEKAVFLFLNKELQIPAFFQELKNRKILDFLSAQIFFPGVSMTFRIYVQAGAPGTLAELGHAWPCLAHAWPIAGHAGPCLAHGWPWRP